MSDERKLIKIELVFENVEVAEIEAKYIEFMDIDEINKSYRHYYNEFKEVMHCQSVHLRISKELAEAKIENCGHIMNLFERIQGLPNIVSIYLHFEDNTEEEIVVPWKSTDSNDIASEYQTAYIDTKRWIGDLIIKIAQDQSAFN